jgi:hypothetical protein
MAIHDIELKLLWTSAYNTTQSRRKSNIIQMPWTIIS